MPKKCGELTWKECLDYCRNQVLRARLRFSTEDSDLYKSSWNFDYKGYAERRRKGVKERAHQVVVFRMFEYAPKKGDGFEIDHINRDKQDNRRENLRIVVYQINRINNDRTVSSKRAHTCRHRMGDTTKWIARIDGRAGAKGWHKSGFATQSEAHNAAMQKRKELGWICKYKDGTEWKETQEKS